MAVELITFDLDHTLWNPDATLQAAEQAMYDWLCEHVANFSSLYRFQDLVDYRLNIARSRPQLAWQVSALRKQVLHLLLLQSGVSKENIAPLVAQAFAVFYQQRSQLPLFAGVESMLQRLSQQCPLIALTNGNADLKLVGIDGYFSAYFNAEMVGAPKPQARLFQVALEQAQVNAAHSVHVGDSITMDVLAAQALGMQTVWVNYQQQRWPEDHTPATLEVNTVAELEQGLLAMLGAN